MVVINFSFQLARCMLSFRDAGIKKQEPLCMAIINSRSNEKKIRESNIPYQISINRAEKSSDWLSAVGRSMEDGDATYV